MRLVVSGLLRHDDPPEPPERIQISQPQARDFAFPRGNHSDLNTLYGALVDAEGTAIDHG